VGFGLLVFGGVVAGEGLFHGVEFDDHVAGMGGAFLVFDFAAAGEEAGAVFLEGGRGGLRVVGIGLSVGHCDVGNPIGFWHLFFALTQLGSQKGFGDVGCFYQVHLDGCCGCIRIIGIDRGVDFFHPLVPGFMTVTGSQCHCT